MTFYKNYFLVLIIFPAVILFADNLAAQNVHSDNGNGTYTNPLISADFPDPDVIRVGVVNDGKTNDSVLTNTSAIYFKTIASNGSSKASFQYSTDNKAFKPFGNDLTMRFSLKIFTGNKFCLFNYATKVLGGCVDVDWFRVE